MSKTNKSWQSKSSGKKDVLLYQSLVNTYQRHAIEDEIFITQRIRAENIVMIYQVFETEENYFIFQEKCDNNFK